MELTLTLSDTDSPANRVLYLTVGVAISLHLVLLTSLQWAKPKAPLSSPRQLNIAFTTTAKPKAQQSEQEPATTANQPKEQQQLQTSATKPAKQLSHPQSQTKDTNPEPARLADASSKKVVTATPKAKPIESAAPIAVGALLESISNEYQKISDNDQYHNFNGPTQKQEFNFDTELFDLKLPQRLKEGSVETYTDVNGQPAYRMVVKGVPVCVSKHEFSFHDSFTPNVWKARPC